MNDNEHYFCVILELLAMPIPFIHTPRQSKADGIVAVGTFPEREREVCAFNHCMIWDSLNRGRLWMNFFHSRESYAWQTSPCLEIQHICWSTGPPPSSSSILLANKRRLRQVSALHSAHLASSTQHWAVFHQKSSWTFTQCAWEKLCFVSSLSLVAGLYVHKCGNPVCVFCDQGPLT